MRLLKSFFWSIPGALIIGQVVGWLLVLFVLALLGSCSRAVWHAPMALPRDSTAAALGLPPARSYKFKGPVTFTIAAAPGAVATTTSTDNRKAGQRGGAAATAPDAVATAATKKAGVPWWALVLVAGAGAVGWAWLSGKFALLPLGRR